MPLTLEEVVNKYKLEDEVISPSKEVALCRAASKGNKPDVTFLLEKGALLNEQLPEKRRTALHGAVENGCYSVVEYLLARRASYDLEDKDGNTALCIAATKNAKIRALFFKKVAQDAFNKIKDKYCFENKLTSEESDNIYTAVCEDTTKEFAVLNGLLKIVNHGLDPGKINSIEERSKLYSLTQLFFGVSVGKKQQATHPKLYNYCQQLCLDLAFEIFHFKVFRQGKIPVSIIKYSWPGAAHVVLSINAQHDHFPEDAVLCNPMRREFFFGKDEIDEYLQTRIFSRPPQEQRKAIFLGRNLYPNLEKIIAGKDEYKQLLEVLEASYLEEARRSKNQYIGASRRLMEDFTRQLYRSKFQSKGSIDNLLSELKLEGQVATSIKSILQKQLAPSNVAPSSSFYQAEVSPLSLNNEEKPKEINDNFVTYYLALTNQQ